MCVRHLTIDTQALEPFECSAMLVAALLYPNAREEERRQRCFRSLCSSFLHELNRVERNQEPFIQPRLNSYLEIPATQAALQFRRFGQLFADRSWAAQIVRPITHEHLLGRPHRPIAGVTRLSLNQLAGVIAPIEDVPKFLRRVWRPSRSALHLAIAVDIVTYDETQSPALQTDRLGAPPPEAIPSYLEHPAWGKVAFWATQVQDWIAVDKRFQVPRDDLLWLDWIA